MARLREPSEPRSTKQLCLVHHRYKETGKFRRQHSVLPLERELKEFCKQGRWQDALRSLNALDALQPSHRSKALELWNWVFIACAKGKAWEHAMQMLKVIHQNRLSTDRSFTIAIQACSKARQWQAGVALVSDLVTDSVTPNAACQESSRLSD